MVLTVNTGFYDHRIISRKKFSEDLKKLDKGIHTNIYKSFDEEGIEFSGGQA